ncbi:MAG: SMP-30/gluconolactonase/LRE family protein [Chitinophagaceae bacterium]
MKKLLLPVCLLLFFAFPSSLCAQFKVSGLFKVRELTKENLFTNNIEGPCFYHDTLFVVNYKKDGTIATISPDGSVHLFLVLPKGSVGNSIKIDSKGNMLLPDFEGHNILKVDQDHHISIYCHDDSFNQPNDICLNRHDQIYASDPLWKDSTGKLWRIDRGGIPVLLRDHMGTTNGIELSPDEKTLYVNESDQLKIWKFDVDARGNISHKRLFAQFSDYGLDGMHCDKKGNLLVCRWGKGVIVEFSPKGKKIREIPLIGKECSNFVFGGKDGKTVFVTLQDRKCMEMFRTNIPGKYY